jgi:hypothetical protein
LVTVVLAVVVLPLVETVVVAFSVGDLVVTVFVDEDVFGAAIAGLAMIASAATEQINLFISSSSSRQECAGEVADISAQVSALWKPG